MAYTVEASFDEFRSNIELSGDHRETATKRKDRIVSLLSKDFDILDSFPSGSVPRYTAIKGYADLDIIVVLHYGKHVKDRLPSKVLLDVRESLSEYQTNIRRNGQAVTLTYKSWPNVDIVPVYRYKNSDGSVNHYGVPNMNNEDWIKSRPVKHTNDMTERNIAIGSRFKRIVKMIKWWNRHHGSYLQSYHIEVMALKILQSTLGEYSWNVYWYFKQAALLAAQPLWHEFSYVDAYLTYSAREEAVNRLQLAAERGLTAWNLTYDTNNNHAEAIRNWKIIFGDEFPSYG